MLVIFGGALMFIFSQCLTVTDKPDARGEEYAGSKKCIKCHEDVYRSYLLTAHYHASQRASGGAVHGSFVHGHDSLTFDDGNAGLVMTKGTKGMYQTAYKKNKKYRSERFDMVFGGNKAESYVYWRGTKPYELPASYYRSLLGWANSPGYDTRLPYFDREVTQRCFECHASYVAQPQVDNTMQNRDPGFDTTTMIYGIDCERCHGPAANHVNFHLANPGEKVAHYITTYKSLSRRQRFDDCAVCHGGNKDELQESAFNFKPGDKLADFKVPRFLPRQLSVADIDVHGDQNGLLAASECFTMSNMDCGTCHDAHKNEAGNLAAYSQKCMTCHTDANFCSYKMAPVALLKTNCIDCHMPSIASKTIYVMVNGKKLSPYRVRTHYISIYPEESKKQLLAFASKLKTAVSPSH